MRVDHTATPLNGHRKSIVADYGAAAEAMQAQALPLSVPPTLGCVASRRAVWLPSPLAASHFSDVLKMHTIATPIQNLRQHIQHIIRRLRRRQTTIEARIAIALPPFIKIEIGLTSEPPKPANDNQPRHEPGHHRSGV